MDSLEKWQKIKCQIKRSNNPESFYLFAPFTSITIVRWTKKYGNVRCALCAFRPILRTTQIIVHIGSGSHFPVFGQQLYSLQNIKHTLPFSQSHTHAFGCLSSTSTMTPSTMHLSIRSLRSLSLCLFQAHRFNCKLIQKYWATTVGIHVRQRQRQQPNKQINTRNVMEY